MPDIGVIFGGPSPEHDVSILTGLQAAHALLAGGGSKTRAIYWSKLGEFFEVDPELEAKAFLEGVPPRAVALQLLVAAPGGFVSEGGRFGRDRSIELEALVVCCHGGPGEDGTLQGSLDLAGIPYAGPTVAGAAIGMDKLAFGALMRAEGLPTLPRAGLERDTSVVEFPGPYIVKPRFGGSSIGIEVVVDLDSARALVGSSPHLRAGAVIEPYRADCYDLQIGVRSWPQLELSAIERPLRAERGGGPGEILGYADKYVGGEGMASAPRELPANVPAGLEATLRGTAQRVARLSSVRGVARIDFLTDGTDLFVNEINTIPGSLSRYLWIEPVRTFAELLGDVIAEAKASPTHRYTTQGADGLVLRGASAIAAKLA